MPAQSDYYSLAEVAELLGVHPKTVRRQIAAGIIPAYKIGRALRIRRSDVDLLLRRVPVA